MKKTVIFGVTAFSLMVKEDMEEDGRPVDAFTVTRDYLPETWSDPTPVVAFEDLREHFAGEPFEVILAVGYMKMGERRRAMFELCDQYGYEIGTFIHSEAKCRADVMGRGNILLAGCEVHRHCRLGDGNILVNDTVIGHDSEIGSFNFFAGMTTGGKIHMGSHCFLGMKSVICNDLEIGDYTLLGVGTVLSKNSEPHTVIMPARNRTMKMGVDEMSSLLI